MAERDERVVSLCPRLSVLAIVLAAVRAVQLEHLAKSYAGNGRLK